MRIFSCFFLMFLLLLQTLFADQHSLIREDTCCGYSSPGNPFQCTDHQYGRGNCTWWCAYKRPEVSGPCLGNAVEWFTQANNGGLPTGQIPAPGSIVVFKQNHVAYIKNVNGNGSFGVSHMGYNAWHGMKEETLTENSFGGVQGYIFPAIPSTNFSFPNHLTEGWQCGNDVESIPQNQPDVNTWMVAAVGKNPGVASPTFMDGINTEQFNSIKFSAKVEGTGSDCKGYFYLKDENNNWNHPICFGDVKRDNMYHVHEGDLSSYNNLQIKQFSIELTEDGEYERWTFDWIKMYSKFYYWDYKNNQLGWSIRQHGYTNDFFANDFWRIKANGKQPQIVSPYLNSITDKYLSIEIRYSVQGDNTDAVTRAYFDIGEGFGPDCFTQSSIKMDGQSKSIIFAIPQSAIGKVQRIMFDLVDNQVVADGKLIAINNIRFHEDVSGIILKNLNSSNTKVTVVKMQNLLKLHVSQPENIGIEIFDISGKKIHSVYNKQVDTGTYILDMDRLGLSSGIYFIKIKGASINKTVKLRYVF